MSIGRTVEIDQLKGGMTVIENIGALPSTADHVVAQGRLKAAHIGSATMEALLHA